MDFFFFEYLSVGLI